ncbi:MAG: MBL fold metallo-hydrolase [Defluviitaleaceae bacterium]|nr:MBL fold metallo-hydrolase [Defluviitaleaceae bacterium]MCL2262352.1 MBL fold metallo-hydrolase [Defluviitaleaceae bacterium]
MKKIFFAAGILLFLLTACGCNCEEMQPWYVPEPEPEPISEMAGMMEVFVFGIGRADAILITTENHAVLIDSGENRHGGPIAGTLMGRGITTLDYLIITHFDADHVGGASQVINILEVQNVIVPNYSRDTRHTRRFQEAVQNAGIVPHVLMEEIRFSLDDAHFIVCPSDLPYFSFVGIDINDDYDIELEEEDQFDNDGNFIPTGDDFSIVVRVEHGNNNFLFMADATTGRRQLLLDCEEFMDTDFDFLKVQRHGRFDRRAPRFIRAVSPQYAVITGFCPTMIDEFYPERPTDDNIISLLDEVGAETFFTMTNSFQVRSDKQRLIRD